MPTMRVLFSASAPIASAPAFPPSIFSRLRRSPFLLTLIRQSFSAETKRKALLVNKEQDDHRHSHQHRLLTLLLLLLILIIIVMSMCLIIITLRVNHHHHRVVVILTADTSTSTTLPPWACPRSGEICKDMPITATTPTTQETLLSKERPVGLAWNRSPHRSLDLPLRPLL